MLADPPVGLRKPLTDLLFLRLPDSAALGTALSGGVRLALANTDRPRLSVLNTCGDSRPVVRWEKLPAISAIFASSFLAAATRPVSRVPGSWSFTRPTRGSTACRASQRNAPVVNRIDGRAVRAGAGSSANR